MVSPAPFTPEFGVCFPVGGVKETSMFIPHPLLKPSVVEKFRDREVACSASDLQGLNFKYCVWRAVSSHSSQNILFTGYFRRASGRLLRISWEVSENSCSCYFPGRGCVRSLLLLNLNPGWLYFLLSFFVSSRTLKHVFYYKIIKINNKTN